MYSYDDITPSCSPRPTSLPLACHELPTWYPTPSDSVPACPFPAREPFPACPDAEASKKALLTVLSASAPVSLVSPPPPRPYANTESPVRLTIRALGTVPVLSPPEVDLSGKSSLAPAPLAASPGGEPSQLGRVVFGGGMCMMCTFRSGAKRGRLWDSSAGVSWVSWLLRRRAPSSLNFSV